MKKPEKEPAERLDAARPVTVPTVTPGVVAILQLCYSVVIKLARAALGAARGRLEVRLAVASCGDSTCDR